LLPWWPRVDDVGIPPGFDLSPHGGFGIAGDDRRPDPVNASADGDNGLAERPIRIRSWAGQGRVIEMQMLSLPVDGITRLGQPFAVALLSFREVVRHPFGLAKATAHALTGG
jgi:hypothetical protein